MTTTSANIAGVMTPFGGMLKRQEPGNVDDIEEITPTGSRRVKYKDGVYEVKMQGGYAVLEMFKNGLVSPSKGRGK